MELESGLVELEKGPYGSFVKNERDIDKHKVHDMAQIHSRESRVVIWIKSLPSNLCRALYSLMP